ncbi:MAG: sigma D regulator [Pseudomonadales bacterium]
MLDQCTIAERWSGVNEMIDRWLHERQSLIVQFCALSGVHEFSPKTERSSLRLQKFCQVLVDYVSTGHFEVYYQLIREAEEFKDGSADLVASLFPSINATTATSMEFNDKHANAKGPFTDLSKDLSKLGETMASRFEFEDRLIDTLHESHREQVIT